MTAALEARGVVRRYDEVAVVDGVDLTAPAGTITAMIGPNGAGKTTLFHCMSGVEPVDEGRVLLGGLDVTAASSDARARLGLAHTFQHSSVFSSMTVEDNLRVAAENRHRRGLIRGLVGLPHPASAAVDAAVERAIAALDLGAVRDRRCDHLPTGTLRLVEMARATCLDPSVLLLDEPASGLSDREIVGLQALLRRLADGGAALVIIEHDIDLVRQVADVVCVLIAGRIAARGRPSDVDADPAVRTALGLRT